MNATVLEVLDQRATWDTSPLPDIQLTTPKLDEASLVAVNFEDPEDNAAVVGSASSPRLSRVQWVTPAVVAQKSGVVLRQPETVVLAILVLEDGQVGEVQMTRSCGSANVDAAAVQYARALRWLPGTKEHRPQAMRISLPVIFSPV